MSAPAAVHARAADGRLALLGWLWRAQARAQPGRALTAVLAIAIGVALALAIHLVNRSALEEFATAMSTVNGEAQAQLRARAGSFDETLYPRLAASANGASVSPVIDAVFALADRPGETLRVIGIDAFRAAAVTPALLPSTGAGEQAGAASPLFADDTVFLSNAALTALGLAEGDTLRLRAGTRTVALQHRNWGEWRTPTLRGLSASAPYMHDGSIATLREVVDFYAAGGRVIADGPNAGDGRANPYKSDLIANITLTPRERADLVAFLKTFTDRRFLTDPRLSDPFKRKP